MLMTMRAQIEAMRALGYYTAAGIDGALKHPDKETARKTQDRVDLLIPIVKAWFTDLGNEIASTGVQIHGGMDLHARRSAAPHRQGLVHRSLQRGRHDGRANEWRHRHQPRNPRGAAPARPAETA